jgi:hypothetical protein
VMNMFQGDTWIFAAPDLAVMQNIPKRMYVNI